MTEYSASATATTTACDHVAFAATVNVHRLTDVGRFVADVSIRCAHCGLAFSFLGPPLGLRSAGPACSVDRTELRIPIEPGPSPVVPGTLSFEVFTRERES